MVSVYYVNFSFYFLSYHQTYKKNKKEAKHFILELQNINVLDDTAHE